MDYKKAGQEILEYMTIAEEHGNILQQHILEMSHGSLAVLRILSNEQDGMNAKELACRLNVGSSRVAAILKCLEKDEYITRSIDEKDRRMIRIFITPRGKQYEKERYAYYCDNISTVLNELGEERTLQYIDIVKRLSQIAITGKFQLEG